MFFAATHQLRKRHCENEGTAIEHVLNERADAQSRDHDPRTCFPALVFDHVRDGIIDVAEAQSVYAVVVVDCQVDEAGIARMRGGKLAQCWSKWVPVARIGGVSASSRASLPIRPRAREQPMRSVSSRSVLTVMFFMSIVGSSAVLAQEGATSLPPSAPGQLTGKERLAEKWMDEQRTDNCKVPMDKRGSKPRPDSCRNGHLVAGSQGLSQVQGQ